MGKREQNKNHDKKPYDSAFKTSMKECKGLIYHLLNETFGTGYTAADKIEFINDEHDEADADSSKSKIITDTSFVVKDENGNLKGRYVYECQSKADKTMAVRMYRYSARVAYENRKVIDGVLHIPFPEAAVLYLRGKGKDEIETSKVMIDFPDGSMEYKVKIFRFRQYTVDELFEKKLYILIPFSIFLYERDLPFCEDNEAKRKKLLEVFDNIEERLEAAFDNGDISAFEKRQLTDLTKYVTDNLAAKYDKIVEGVDDIMGGHLLEFESTRIKNAGVREGRREGRKEGRREGRLEGRNQLLVTIIEGMADRYGMTIEDACAHAGVTRDQYEQAKEELSKIDEV